jgi:nucleotide-binding universal stress UspA family protein
MLTKGKKDLIVVPYDFTIQSETALTHASKIAMQSEDEVRMLHIINGETNGRLKKMGKEALGVEGALKEIAANNEKAFNVQTTYHTESGSIFTGIGAYIDASGASLAVMGTHGVQGFQHIVGANALKVITSSNAPFVVVQKRKIDPDGYRRIVVPVDGNIKGKNKITAAIDLAKYFNSTIYIFEANTTDQFVANRTAVNMKMIKEFIQESNIPFEQVKEEGKGSFAKQLIKYSAHIDADLIVISSHHDNEGLMDYIFGGEEVQVLNNDPQIAVLCVNPVASATSDVNI